MLLFSIYFYYKKEFRFAKFSALSAFAACTWYGIPGTAAEITL